LSFWDELQVIAFAPRVRISPLHPFDEQDAAHLASPDSDPTLSGSGREGIQRPMSFLLLIGGLQLPTSTSDQPPWRIGANQRYDQGALGFGDASLASCSWAIAKPIESLLVEAMDAFAHRLRVAPELRSDLRGAKSIPAEGDHPSAHYPIQSLGA
jgi:hypothetical protein